ncbi:MAG: hypothetical protein ACFFD2_12605 [Promethearchaeota archaeon]
MSGGCVPGWVQVAGAPPGGINTRKTVPEMRDLCNDSFNNLKVKVIIGDTIEFLLNSKEKFDVIIDDCDVDTTKQNFNFNWSKYYDYQNQLIKKLKSGE